MKKQLFHLLLSFWLFALVLACNTPDKLLVKKEGTWDIKLHRIKTTIKDSVLMDAALLGGKVIFNENLTGFWVSNDSDSVAINWYYNPETDQLTTLTPDLDSNGFWEPRVWDIKISTKESQEWETVFSYYILSDSLLRKNAETLELERKF